MDRMHGDEEALRRDGMGREGADVVRRLVGATLTSGGAAVLLWGLHVLALG